MSARSGTENRQRQNLVATRMTPQELAQVKAAAEARGVSVSQMMRESTLAAAR